MKTAKQIKYERLVTKVVKAEEWVAFYDNRPYNWFNEIQLAKWESNLRHRKAMLARFEATLK